MSSKLTYLLVFFLTLFVTGINLFGYPLLQGDEGVYVGQAWWLVHFGQISPYTYWYDHFPFGWLQIGLWQLFTNGPFTFGLAVFSGRVFISLLVSLTNVFVFEITKKLTKRSEIAFLASLLFALSPLCLYFHRQILLDNIATFWLMLAILIFIKNRGFLINYFFSGLFFGLSFLSKEAVIFFLPAFFYGLFIFTKKANRSFSFLLFLTTFFILISLFPMLALVKKEFFPSSWTGSGPHVSLLETIKYQAGRGNQLAFWQKESEFNHSLAQWLNLDRYFLLWATWSLLVLLVKSPSRKHRLIPIFSLSFLLFLLRGGTVLGFYLIPLLPFLSINLALFFDLVLKKISGASPANSLEAESSEAPIEIGAKEDASHIFSSIAVIFLIIFLSFLYQPTLQTYFLKDQTWPLRQAIDYAKQNFPQESVIVTDFTPWVDLRLKRNPEDKDFPNVEWFYKVESDPAIRINKLNNDWHKVDYFILTQEMVFEIDKGGYPFIKEILENSSLIAEFSENNQPGWVKIYKVN